MSEQQAQGADEAIDLNNELKARREKLAALREQGVAFPNDFRRDHTSDQLHAEFGHHPTSHRNFNVQGSEFIVVLRIEFSMQLVRGMIATEIVGESYALLTQRSIQDR